MRISPLRIADWGLRIGSACVEGPATTDPQSEIRNPQLSRIT